MLSLALKGEKRFPPKAFQQYHRAITSVRTHPRDLSSDGILYFHFLLLIYDLCCASQGMYLPKKKWHDVYVDSAYQVTYQCCAPSTWKGYWRFIQSYLWWYILSLDVQAFLSGQDTGNTVKAYTGKRIFLPRLRLSSSSIISPIRESLINRSLVSRSSPVDPETEFQDRK